MVFKNINLLRAKKARIIYFGLILLVAFLLISKTNSAYAFSGGDGTTENPYLISNCSMLQDMTSDLSASYKLTTNIDCSDTINWNSGSGFSPIGDMSNHFTGSLDGNSKVVNGLYISRDQWWIGLIGVLDEVGSVHDITLSNVNITGGAYDVGSLVGAAAGTITNAHSSGTVHGRGNVGGLVGLHTEQSSLGSSSPLVYTWNGSKYIYVADVGHTTPTNVKGNDSVAISGDSLQPKNGVYNLKISQEYDEIVYYDQLALKTYDTTPGYQVVPQLEPSKQESGISINKTPTNPATSCVDKYGHDCLSAVSSIDDNWTYQDLATNVNTYTVDFGDLSSSSRKILILNGVRDFKLKSPQSLKYIQVKDAGGNWVNVLNGKSQLDGLKGAPRTAAVDMSNLFLTNDYHVRIGYDKTTLNYIAMDTSPAQSFTENTYHPTSANLQFRGYTAVDTSGAYWKHDYYNVKSYPSELFSSPSGNFTKYGDVAPLLQNSNDQYVIMHHGDSMDINFDYNPVPAGKERSFILYSDALYKHATPDSWSHTVNPLPFKGMTTYPYPDSQSYPNTQSNQDYLKNWNTRVYKSPLDPATHHTIIDSSSSATVHGYYAVGGLVGSNRSKLITGSHATGDVVATNYYAGGLVGMNENGNAPAQIVDSFSTGSVQSNYYAGGLVGYNLYSTISKSYSTGNVSGISVVGGLIGTSGDNHTNPIENVFATGNVEASNEGGGLIGAAVFMDTNHAYATGNVSDGENLGGIAGYNVDSNFTDTFWDTQTSGISSAADSSGAGIGKTTTQMKDIRTFTDLSYNADLTSPVFDFIGTPNNDSSSTDIWTIDSMNNNGYPYFGNSQTNTIPNHGDTNGDGIQDNYQSNVISYVNPVTNKHVALEVSSNCTPDYSTMENSSNMQTSDGKYKYPAGLMNFTLDCPQAGDTATITQYFYDLSSTGLVARKYNSSTKTYSTIPGSTISQITIDGHIVTKITYQITDGGPLDQDSTVNGIIVDPSGPAAVSISATGATPNTGFGHIIDTNNLIIIASSVLAALLVGGAYILNKKENK